MRTSPESQPGIGFTGASKKNLPIEFFSRRDSEGITAPVVACGTVTDFITEMPTLGVKWDYTNTFKLV